MQSVREAVVPPVVGYQVHVNSALSWGLGLSVLTSVNVPFLLTPLGTVTLLLQAVVLSGFVSCRNWSVKGI